MKPGKTLTTAERSHEPGRESAAHLLRVSAEAKTTIRRVDQVAQDIDLVAINASLTVRGTHSGIAGYRVVAAELRRLSANLNELMNRLLHAMARVVELASRFMSVSHRMGLLPSDDGVGAAAAERTRAVRQERQAVLASLRQQVGREWQAVGRDVARAIYLVDTGRQLARSARVEAVYCGELSASLSEVAERFSGAIDEVGQHLNGLKQLRESME